MPYTGYYNNFPSYTVPFGSRSGAAIFPGAVCPMKASFGRGHGPAAMRGTIEFKGVILLPVAQILTIQIGQSIFYGMVVKGEIAESVVTGRNTTFLMVDARDRLHDLNHFAQYNMLDNDGTWWHILEQDWPAQSESYVNNLQKASDFSEGQTLPTFDINALKPCPPIFSAMTLLQYFALRYHFTFSWTGNAIPPQNKFQPTLSGSGGMLSSTYPDNLNFNSGTTIAEAIQTILEKCNLQFTAFGDLHLHITQPGKPDSFFEHALLSGNINLCNFTSHIDAHLGAELNERGRNVAIVGGRNKDENWYPCVPDWNQNFVPEVCFFFDTAYSAFLQEHGVVGLDKVSSLPFRFWDFKKFQGKPRNEMNIIDYINKICFKAYKIDFAIKLYEETDPAALAFFNDPNNAVPGFDPPDNKAFYVDPLAHKLSNIADREQFLFNISNYLSTVHQTFRNLRNGQLSSNLITDSNLQFYCKANKVFVGPGQDNQDVIPEGNFRFVYFDDGVNLEIEEIITGSTISRYQPGFEGDPNFIIDIENVPFEEWCRKRYECTLYFTESRMRVGYEEKIEVFIGAPDKTVQVPTYIPDHVFARVCVERELFTWLRGEPTHYIVTLPASNIPGGIFGGSTFTYYNPRVRQKAINVPELHASSIDTVSVPMLAKNFLDTGFISRVFPEDLAEVIAIRALNHEFITTAGHITFRGNAGFIPSGVIDSVNVTFDANSGIREVINFTNIFNDDRVETFFTFETKTPVIGIVEEERRRKLEELRRGARELGHLTNKTSLPGTVNDLGLTVAFGIEQNSAMVRFEKSDLGDEFLFNGDVLIVQGAKRLDENDPAQDKDDYEIPTDKLIELLTLLGPESIDGALSSDDPEIT